MYGEACFNKKKCLQKGETWIGYYEPEWKHINSLVKTKFRVQQAVKKAMLTVFWGMKGPIIIDFFEKAATVNNVFFCQIQKQNSPFLLNDPYKYTKIFNTI